MLFSGAWGKMIHEKNLKQKSCDPVPSKRHDTFVCFLINSLKGLSHEIDFKNFDKNLQNLT
jgi:hypothetical protein